MQLLSRRSCMSLRSSCRTGIRYLTSQKDAPLADYKIKLTCAKFRNCVVVPLPAGVIGENGIKPEYSLSDSTHLNGKAYALWKDELNKAMASFPYSVYYKYFK